MSNVCAIRTMRHVQIWKSIQENVLTFDQPHEPVMNTSGAVWGTAQKETRLLVVDPRNSHDAVYLCKHCGCLYAEES